MAISKLLKMCNEARISDGVLREFIIKANDKVILHCLEDSIKVRQDQIKVLEEIRTLVIEKEPEND